MYKFKIIKNKKGEFRAQFCYNKEVIFWTETYLKKPSCKNAIEKFIKNASAAMIEEIDENAKPAAKMPAKVAAKPTAKKTATKKVEVKM